MRNKIFLRLLMAIALLILAIPVVASAQIYDRAYDRDERRDARQAINRLETASARLQGDLNVTRGRRVFGFWIGNNNSAALQQVNNFRLAVRDLRAASNRGRNLRDSEDEARMVINQGLQLDRYLRLRTGRTDVDADLADLRSGLNLLANAYDLRVRY
jgi:plasmid stabilization system protein ParE